MTQNEMMKVLVTCQAEMQKLDNEFKKRPYSKQILSRIETIHFKMWQLEAIIKEKLSGYKVKYTYLEVKGNN